MKGAVQLLSSRLRFPWLCTSHSPVMPVITRVMGRDLNDASSVVLMVFDGE